MMIQLVFLGTGQVLFLRTSQVKYFATTAGSAAANAEQLCAQSAVQLCHPYQCSVFHWSYEAGFKKKIISEHVSFHLLMDARGRSFPRGSKVHGKKYPTQDFNKNCTTQGLSCLVHFYFGFCLNCTQFIQPWMGQQGDVKHSEHSPYTPSTDCSIHHP